MIGLVLLLAAALGAPLAPHYSGLDHVPDGCYPSGSVLKFTFDDITAGTSNNGNSGNNNIIPAFFKIHDIGTPAADASFKLFINGQERNIGETYQIGGAATAGIDAAHLLTSPAVGYVQATKLGVTTKDILISFYGKELLFRVSTLMLHRSLLVPHAIWNGRRKR